MPLHEYQKQMYQKIGVIAALIILPIAGFFAGVIYQKQTTPGTDSNMRGGQMNGQLGQMMKNRAMGTIKSISDTSITVTSHIDNSDKTYTITNSTTYKNGTDSAVSSDISEGDEAMLTLDSNDSTKVKTVTINPVMGGGLGGPDRASSNLY